MENIRASGFQQADGTDYFQQALRGKCSQYGPFHYVRYPKLQC